MHSPGDTGRNKRRIILDLCGGTGSWSEPYRAAGYDVRLISLPEHDVFTYKPPSKVHGVLASPPCTHLCHTGAPSWKAKGVTALTEALQTVYRCLLIIKQVQPVFWALENPAGRLKRFLGDPQMSFQPFEYGDLWPKHTLLWGRFKPPYRRRLAFSPVYSRERLSYASNRAMFRSITPPGFARSFFEVNQ